NEWPWGNEWDAGKCNSRESKIGGTTPVDHYSPAGDSPYGVADMAGNVWEWCSSLLKPYPYRRDDGREALKAKGHRVVRGGAFVGVARLVRCASRYRDLPSSRYGAQGFRVVVSPVSPDSEL
ncbi:MAG TPA: formylglycine-generating enzyme family protein, partial [Anaerolineales bacterium]|nr:formylglycine-generating enzyme family protein [Anaerolineales bacterium]